jgi:hypothetical protein
MALDYFGSTKCLGTEELASVIRTVFGDPNARNGILVKAQDLVIGCINESQAPAIAEVIAHLWNAAGTRPFRMRQAVLLAMATAVSDVFQNKPEWWLPFEASVIAQWRKDEPFDRNFHVQISSDTEAPE